MLSFAKLGSMLVILLATGYILYFDDTHVYLSLHTLIYWSTADVLIIALVKSTLQRKDKIIGVLVQVAILAAHIYLVFMLDWSALNKILSAALFLLSFVLDYYAFKRRDVPFVMSELGEETVAYHDIGKVKRQLFKRSKTLEAVGKVITLKLIKELILDINHVSTVRYKNQNHLSEEYLADLDKSIEDDYVYLVLSDTGSPASDVIGLFTQAMYNHISIAFDHGLKTLISYNAGLRVTPPGLNAEMIHHFYRKADASIRIYRLPVTKEQKQGMINRVKIIDSEGSAYNLVGLALKRNQSSSPNNLFCSQFVYQLLCVVGAEYFTKPPRAIHPSDFIELDYDRRLEFVELIQLAVQE